MDPRQDTSDPVNNLEERYYTNLLAGFISGFTQTITDFNQTHDPECHTNAAKDIGRLKTNNEYHLRDDLNPWPESTYEYDKSAAIARAQLRTIDEIIAKADADQLRHIIDGMTSALHD